MKEVGGIEKISVDLINLGFSEEEAEIEVLAKDGFRVSGRILAELKKTINLTPGLARIARKKRLKIHQTTIRKTKATVLFFLNKTIERLETVREIRALEKCWKDLLQRAYDLGLLKKAECKFKIIAIKKDLITLSFHTSLVNFLKEISQTRDTTDMDIRFGKDNIVTFSLTTEETQFTLPPIHCVHYAFVRNILRRIIGRNPAEKRAKAERIGDAKRAVEKLAQNLFLPLGPAVKKITVYYKKGIYYVPIIINSLKVKASFPSLASVIDKVSEIEFHLTDFNVKNRNSMKIIQKGGIYQLTLKINSFRVLLSASDVPKMEAELEQKAKKLKDLFALKDA